MVKLYGFCLSIAYITRRCHPYIESLPTLWCCQSDVRQLGGDGCQLVPWHADVALVGCGIPMAQHLHHWVLNACLGSSSHRPNMKAVTTKMSRINVHSLQQFCSAWAGHTRSGAIGGCPLTHLQGSHCLRVKLMNRCWIPQSAWSRKMPGSMLPTA